MDEIIEQVMASFKEEITSILADDENQAELRKMLHDQLYTWLIRKLEGTYSDY